MRRWQGNCEQRTLMTKVSCLLLLVLCLLPACTTPQTARVTRFNEQEQANLIVRYYTDDTSYVVKPAATEGPFLSILKKDDVVGLAKQQPGRELAVVILIYYPNEDQATLVKSQWMALLTKAGYQRVVFLRSSGGRKINGLPVLAGGG
jgi:hypothetical protein